MPMRRRPRLNVVYMECGRIECFSFTLQDLFKSRLNVVQSLGWKNAGFGCMQDNV